MINLLPPNSRQAYVFAHRNTRLIKVITGIAVGIAGILAVTVCGLIYLQQQSTLYEDSIAATKAELKAQNETETIQRVQDISNSLKLVVDVLSQEILFSELLRQVGGVMPPGTVLQNLSLDNELNGALDLQVGAVDYQSASQVQVNLEDPENGLFTGADLVNIACSQPGESDEPDPYPCKVTLRALFDNDNDFMLLSTSKEATQ